MRPSPRSLSRADLLGLLISLLAAFGALYITTRIFEGVPHLEDEFAYVWQAQAIAGGQATLPSPPNEKQFLVPFVVDYNGQRFGKYPLGWPAVLGVGERIGLREWVNPLLAALAVWLTYLLGKRLLNETVGVLAAFLTLTSPFFLLNSGTLLSHPLGLFLSLAFCLAWLDAFGGLRDSRQDGFSLLIAAFSLGLLALTRPLTAVAVALPFGLHGMVLMVQGDGRTRRRLVGFAALAGAVSALQLLWQFAATGDPFFNLYTLWWPYDQVGFGAGVGRYGHNLQLALLNTRFSLSAGWRDLFGWGPFSWIFLPFGLWAVRGNKGMLRVGGIALSLVVFYLAYWVGSWLFGPRYYYEGLPGLTILSAAGIAWLAGWPLAPGEPWPRRTGRARWRPLAMTALVALLVSTNLIFYTPLRLGGMRGLFGISRTQLVPFERAADQGLAPALIIVHTDDWRDYGGLLALADPYLDTPFIFAISRGPSADAALIAAFPERQPYHYYPDQPFELIKPN